MSVDAPSVRTFYLSRRLLQRNRLESDASRLQQSSHLLKTALPAQGHILVLTTPPRQFGFATLNLASKQIRGSRLAGILPQLHTPQCRQGPCRPRCETYPSPYVIIVGPLPQGEAPWADAEEPQVAPAFRGQSEGDPPVDAPKTAQEGGAADLSIHAELRQALVS